MKTFNFFKRFCGAALVLLAMATPMFTSCYDDSALNEKLEAVQNEVSQIKTDLTQLKSDLAALKAAVESNLAIAQLKQLPDGYELVFSDGTKAVIKNGTSSVVGAKADEDGIYYWTLNGEWLLDADGNKIKASAEDGEDGQDGHSSEVALKLDEDGYYYWTVDGEWLLDEDGEKVRANGIDGKEPTVKMEWSTSNEMWVWIVNGSRVVDAEGNPVPAQGPAGLDGDAFFESVELSEDGTKLIITLLPETEGGENVVYEIPMGVFDIVFDAASAEGVTSDLKKFNYTISGVSAGDEVIVRVLSTNATGVKVVAETNATGYVELELPLGEGYADIYALNNTTGEIKAKSLTLSGCDFYLEEQVEATLHFSPAEANEVKIPLTTGVSYEVNTSGIDTDWLTVEIEPRTRAVSYENLVLRASANQSGAHRTATITITKSADGSTLAEFEVEQKNYNPAFICDENNEPIKWEETFGVYASESDAESGTDPKAEYTNVFTIALSDDFSKGAYKISNMFKVDAYYGEGYQTISGKGGVYYADYEDNTLTVKMANAVKSYFFTSDVALTYDADANTFSSTSALSFTANSAWTSWYRAGYIGGYSAAVKVEEPGTPGVEANPLAEAVIGEYEESGFSGRPSPGTLVIKASDDPSKGDLLVKFGFDSTEFYAKVGGDANTTTITISETSTTSFGPVSASLSFISSAKYIYGTVTYGWGSIGTYSAQKK